MVYQLLQGASALDASVIWLLLGVCCSFGGQQRVFLASASFRHALMRVAVIVTALAPGVVSSK